MFNERNTPVRIALDEYSSIAKAHLEYVIRPVVQKNEKIDRDAVSMTKADLEWKIKDSSFQDLPLNVQTAYKVFRNFEEVLTLTPDEEIEKLKPVLEGIFNINIGCNVNGEQIRDGIDGIYHGRNPCRETQYMMHSRLKTAERDGSSKLLDAAKEMFDSCKMCPYK